MYKPEITKNVVYYEIRGATLPDLRAQINLLGPKDDTDTKGAKDRDARTTAELKWDFKSRDTKSGCEMAGLRMPIKFTILYPKWVNINEASEDAINKWNTYFKALELHEETHVAIELKEVDALYAMLTRLPTNISCKELRELADSKTKELDEADIKVQKQFDADTGNRLTPKSKDLFIF